MHRILHRPIAEFIRPAVRDAAPDAAAREQHAVGLAMMVAPDIVRRTAVTPTLQHRSAPKLRPNHDQGFIQQAAFPQISDQRRHRPVELPGLVGEAIEQAAVVIPALVEQLDKAHALLNKPPRQQAVVGQARCARFRTVSLQGRGWFAADVHQFRHAALHAVRQLVLRDARRDLWVADIRQRDPIQRVNAIDNVAAALWRDTARIGEEQHRIALAAEFHPLMDRRQKATPPQAVARAGHAAGDQHHVAGQIPVRGSQPVTHPRADPRPAESLESGVKE